MLKGFANFDPATEKKLAAHPDLPAFACEHGHREGATAGEQATGDLIMIAFYFLLRVGEYTTSTRRKKQRRTQQFRMKDIVFFRLKENGMLAPLPASATAEEIMAAEAATLCISNQKNGHKGSCIHLRRRTTGGALCPIRALGRRFLHIREHTSDPNTLINAFWDRVGRGSVTHDNISFAVKFAASALRYDTERNIDLRRIDTHSLRSGGACALSLSGHKDREIMKMGRWAPTSTCFMEYIQSQLSEFSVGMADKMSSIGVFTNMEGAVMREDVRHLTVH